MGKRIILGLFAGILFISACSLPSYIKVDVLHPPTVSMPGIKEIAIADFQGTDRSGSQIATQLQSMVMETEYYDIMEREKLRQVLEEQNLGMSGVVDEATAARIGAMLGVDALIFGDVTMYDVEDMEMEKTVKERRGTGKYRTVEKKDKKTGEVKQVKEEIYEEVFVPYKYWVRKGNVAINFRIVDVESGRLLAAHSESNSYDSEKDRSFMQKITDSRQMKPKAEILDNLSRSICRKFAKMIAPYRTREDRTIEPGPGNIGVGVKYAESGLWPEAKEAWEKAIVELPEESAPMYNLGLAYEIEGLLDEAEDAYKLALEKKSKTRYMEAIARIRKRKEEQKKLQQQMEERDEKER